jgi:hypothetical protein
MEESPITHRVYLIGGFVLSGGIYIQDANYKHMGLVCKYEYLTIPENRLFDIYSHLEKQRLERRSNGIHG